MRKAALLFATLAAAAAVSAPASAQTGPPDVKEIVGDLIVCVMAPCP